ncbi:hypothetical protein [Rhodobium gokarnense]|uniref:Uncharacterized protein n=1 Tax=Rhodobium gokarnense TaxID=364296 RepID=A0ABT3HDG5_9HYPH|nr:hypothetical protein [Rhodobium gokarnense]MCW2308326.1 hypothetical protein [Rhodobium gokarnense]
MTSSPSAMPDATRAVPTDTTPTGTTPTGTTGTTGTTHEMKEPMQ